MEAPLCCLLPLRRNATRASSTIVVKESLKQALQLFWVHCLARGRGPLTPPATAAAAALGAASCRSAGQHGKMNKQLQIKELNNHHVIQKLFICLKQRKKAHAILSGGKTEAVRSTVARAGIRACQQGPAGAAARCPKNSKSESGSSCGPAGQHAAHKGGQLVGNQRVRRHIRVEAAPVGVGEGRPIQLQGSRARGSRRSGRQQPRQLEPARCFYPADGAHSQQGVQRRSPAMWTAFAGTTFHPLTTPLACRV